MYQYTNKEARPLSGLCSLQLISISLLILQYRFIHHNINTPLMATNTPPSDAEQPQSEPFQGSSQGEEEPSFRMLFHRVLVG